MQGYLTVTEAARELGVTRGRIDQLRRAGRLDATKFGERWAIDRASVSRQAQVVTGAGTSRSLSARSFWGLAAMLDGLGTPSLSASSRTKVRNRARHVQSVNQVRRWGEARYARTLTLAVAPGTVESLLSDSRGVRAGVSTVAHLDAWDEVEIVVAADDVDGLVRDNRLAKYIVGDTRATLHVVADRADVVTTRLGTALDLAESVDGRTSGTGTDQLQMLLAKMRSL